MSDSVRSAAIYSLLQRYIGFLTNLISSIILARLLSPHETGIYSLSLAVVFLANTLRDFGLGEYIVQARELSRETLRAAYTASLLIAWTLGAAMALFATPIAAYFHEPGIRKVLQVLAINFALVPVGTTAFALLTKELAFGAIFRVQTLSNLTGSTISIILAWQGHSYMSLAWGALVSAAITCVHLAILRPSDTLMRPGLRGVRAAIKFGGALTLGRMADQVGMRLPDLIIGRFLGFSAVGINSKSESLSTAFFDFFVTAILRVATPALSKSSDEKHFRDAFLHLLEIVSLLQLLFFGFLILYADPIIEVLFGKRWLECTPLLQIGAVGGIFWTPYMLASSALTARGEALKQMRLQLIILPFGIAMVVIGSQYSLIAISLLGLATLALRLTLLQRVFTDSTQIRPQTLLRTIRPSILVASAGIAAAGIPIASSSPESKNLFILLQGAFALAAGSIATALLVRHPAIGEIHRFIGLIRNRKMHKRQNDR